MTQSEAERRRALILGAIDLSEGRCLEIGPLASPVVLRDMADVRYVDVTDRAGLVEHYGPDPSVDSDLIPEMDHWLTREDGTVSTLAEAVAPSAPFHQVVASHVIEHVPDVVGWLEDVAHVLVDGGALLLAVPDRRFCFDARRAPATVGMALLAHDLGDRTPSIRAVYDHFRKAVEFPADRAWHGTWPPPPPAYTIDQVRSEIARQRTGAYVDVHVWPMTPVELVDFMGDLFELDLLDFTVEQVLPTPVGHHEFYVTLRRIPRAAARDELMATETARVAELRAALPDEERTWPQQVREAELLRRLDELEPARGQLDRTLAQRDRARLVRDRAVRQRDKAIRQRDKAIRQRDRARRRAKLLAAQLEQERSRFLARVGRRLRRKA